MTLTRRGLAALASAPLWPGTVLAQTPAITPSGPRPATVWPLNVTESDFGPSARASEAARAALTRAARYPHVEEDDLISRLAILNGVSPENVAVTTGALEALAMTAVEWARGGRLAAPALTYDTHIGYLIRRGGEAKRVPMRPDFQIDLDAMVEASKDARLVYLCNPNNPTGLAADPAALRDACIRASAHAPVIVDEAFIDLMDEPGRHSLVDLARGSRHDVVVIGTFSKSYALAGLRVGYAIGPGERIAAIKVLLTTSHNAVGLAAASACYGEAAYLAAHREAIRLGRETLHRTLDAHRIPYLPSVAPYLWIDLGPEAAVRLGRLGALGAPLRQFGTANPGWARVAVRDAEAHAAFARLLPEALAA